MKTFASALVAFLLMPTLAMAQGGPLEPPGPPGATMRSLEEVEPRIPISEVPYTITEPGSYYLTGNLTIETGESAITITADNVTLDLMGFTLQGTEAAGQRGVDIALGKQNVTVRNGTIRNMGEEGISANWAESCLYEHLSIDENGAEGEFSDGLSGGAGAIVRFVTATGNDNRGIAIRDGSVTNAVARNNGTAGISSASGNVTNSVARDNGGVGIQADAGSVINSIARSNGGHGISASSIVTNSVARFNGGNGISVNDGNVTNSDGSNNGGHGIFANRGSVTNSTARHNEGDGIWVEHQGVVAFCQASSNDGANINAPNATRTGNHPND
ncbi:MAG: right-handed parallel beta-helix repeat-containing protein [Kiritimatiellae bacterium]|nr:right-handed parallel beta-helix repeat-containing protein [Kiritimatiellia bacterium]